MGLQHQAAVNPINLDALREHMGEEYTLNPKPLYTCTPCESTCGNLTTRLRRSLPVRPRSQDRNSMASLMRSGFSRRICMAKEGGKCGF